MHPGPNSQPRERIAHLSTLRSSAVVGDQGYKRARNGGRMTRIIVVAGVHLDRAWPELGNTFGNALRLWSREVLARLVDEARRRDAEAIVIAGNLMDRSTVLPETVEYAATVLGSFPGRVLVAPGSTDW